MTEAIMRDFKADWQRWSTVERIAAMLALGATGMLPGLLLLVTG